MYQELEGLSLRHLFHLQVHPVHDLYLYNTVYQVCPNKIAHELYLISYPIAVSFHR